jgi:hypothetical protein
MPDRDLIELVNNPIPILISVLDVSWPYLSERLLRTVSDLLLVFEKPNCLEPKRLAHRLTRAPQVIELPEDLVLLHNLISCKGKLSADVVAPIFPLIFPAQRGLQTLVFNDSVCVVRREHAKDGRKLPVTTGENVRPSGIENVCRHFESLIEESGVES